jgi:hypothetical protein
MSELIFEINNRYVNQKKIAGNKCVINVDKNNKNVGA